MRVVVPPVIGVDPTVRDNAAPAGVAQVPSPRQNVVAVADVPLSRFATGRFPVTPVESGRPVAFVSVAAEGVPRFGVTKVGEVSRTTAPVPVTPLLKSDAASWLTETLPPTVDCLRT